MGREIFAQMAGVTASNKGDYIKKGSGRCVILECLKKTSADSGGDVFIARVKIVSSKGKDGSTPNTPGEKVGWPQLLTKYKQTALPNVKSFVLNVVGAKESEITADEFIAQFEDAINYKAGEKSEYNQRVITAVQDFRGMLVDYDTYDQQTKDQKADTKAGKPFQTNTYVNWSHVAEQGDLEKRRAELDVSDPLRG